MTTKPLDVTALIAERKKEYESKLFAFEKAGTWEDLDQQYNLFKKEIFLDIKYQLGHLPMETVESLQKNLLKHLNSVKKEVNENKFDSEETNDFHTEQREQLEKAQVKLNAFSPEKLLVEYQDAFLLDHHHLNEMLVSEGLRTNNLYHWSSFVNEINVNQLLLNQKIYLKDSNGLLPYCLIRTPKGIKVECLALNIEDDSALLSIVKEVVENKQILVTFEPSSVGKHSQLCLFIETSKNASFTVGQVLTHAKETINLIRKSIQDIQDDLDFKVQKLEFVRDALKEWDSVRYL